MKKYLAGICIIILTVCACTTSRQKEKLDEFERKAERNGGMVFSGNSNGNKALPGTPYGYEIWSQSGNDNRLIWYGPNYGGGGAFRAEWNNPVVFLGRVGLFWNRGMPYTYYGDVFCDFEFTRSGNGTAGGTSYIGIYGWSRNPMIEWYIVEDWYSSGVITPSRIGGGARKVGEFTVDGAVYFIYHAIRPAGSGNIEGHRNPFPQYFSVRQSTRQSGTISIT
ncbi:MAG: glycoside hydrolase family 11 protein [Treponema sp.]|nr:glycoside hydrolase family 11 protein [Treponema sp.]